MGRNIKLTVEYDGTDYCGWQTQRNGPTIQETLEKAIEAVVGSPVTVYGSGRTDAGVHAMGQVANFNTESGLSCRKLPDAINAHLPPGIAVLGAEEADPDFHARRSAKSKVYRYVILNRQMRSALERDRCLFFRSHLDLEKMREAAAFFVGRHDFAAFCAEPPENTVREVRHLDIARRGDFIDVEIEADGFLYNMVRRIVGTLLEVGRGKMSADEARGLLDGTKKGTGGPTVPAKGLYLVGVKY